MFQKKNKGRHRTGSWPTPKCLDILPAFFRLKKLKRLQPKVALRLVWSKKWVCTFHSLTVLNTDFWFLRTKSALCGVLTKTHLEGFHNQRCSGMVCDKASFARETRSVTGLQIERKNACQMCGPRSVAITHVPGLGAFCEYCREAHCAQLTSFTWGKRRKTEALTEERRSSRKSLRGISSCGSIQEGVKRKREAKGQIIDYVWYDKSSEASLSKVMRLLRPSKKGKMTIRKCMFRREAINLPGTLNVFQLPAGELQARPQAGGARAPFTKYPGKDNCTCGRRRTVHDGHGGSGHLSYCMDLQEV